MSDLHTAPIAVVGGTGPQGRGLAYRLARAGHPVVLGSRDADRAAGAAAALRALPGVTAPVDGAANRDAVLRAAVVLLAVPYQGHAELVGSLADVLAGRLIVSCVNPLGFDKGGPYGLPVVAGSAAEEAAHLVPTATVVGAFHHLAAPLLLDPEADLSHEDVLVCGDDAQAKARVLALAAQVTEGRAVDAGRLRLAAQLEPLTAVLISVNKRYRTRSGVALTGLAPAVKEEVA
ncbi:MULTISPECIES: NADPH-dependent F420 reductase [Streptomyces]|uniref:NADPH-dependent F420 reductase n=2 Tax=Streptomyces TaxID=1883 RepID=A0ABD5EXS0_9ACTN|nr:MULTISPECIES: NADPH-dependent F420 reductase [unclassified Streptomyces]MDT0438779.1 NADPH-dependent F420 reductase [Streptomyces sp. DSM 41981]MYQ66586.1 NADPH-dependent F420 reductase [Streptomyces sp. SID4950]SCE22635.1 reduced coenzyme F420:NADP oxidoreductase [Streptomyces sp. SolWspMP-5a-2]